VHPGTRDRLRRVDEVAGEPQAELLRLADAVAGEGVDGVLLRVRGQHAGVVTGQVGGVEVAGQRGADVEVDDLVPLAAVGRAAVDPDEAGLRLAVLVLAERERRLGRHRQLPR
jgi:hypothetical protein